MAAIISTIGFASIVVFSAAKAPFTVLMTPAIFGTTVMIVPTADMTFPITISTGPSAAARRAIVTTVFFVPSLSPFNQSTNFCTHPTICLMAGIRSSPKDIARPSNADFKIVICPCKLSSCVSAICCAAPPLSVMDFCKLSHVLPVLASSAFTEDRSVLLKIVPMMLDFSADVIPSMLLFRSPRISFIDRMFPSESYTEMPSASIWAAALSVGFCSDRIMLRRCVPPSAPLIPLLARIPSAVLSSAVPPLMDLAVAPMVRIPSPSCATDVFVVDAVLAIWSTIVSASSTPMPSADMASVTMSEASARAISPAAARLSTVGSVLHICSVSYPARAR